MKVVQTGMTDLVVVQSLVFADDRGFFVEVHHKEKFAALGLPNEFVQDNHSRSTHNVLRGMHFQRTRPQGKLVRPVTGMIYDVAVDLRGSSPTFSQWFGIHLEAGDGQQLYIPPGFAHGFLVLSDTADVSYKCTTMYDGASDAALAWNDPAVGIHWPLSSAQPPLLSSKDAAAPLLHAITPFA